MYIWNLRSRDNLSANLRTGKKGRPIGPRGHRGGRRGYGGEGLRGRYGAGVMVAAKGDSTINIQIRAMSQSKKRGVHGDIQFTFQRLKYKNQIYEIEKLTVVSLSLSAHTAPSVTTTNNRIDNTRNVKYYSCIAPANCPSKWKVNKILILMIILNVPSNVFNVSRSHIIFGPKRWLSNQTNIFCLESTSCPPHCNSF